MKIVCCRIGNLFWARDWFRYGDGNDRFWFSIPVGGRFVVPWEDFFERSDVRCVDTRRSLDLFLDRVHGRLSLW